MNIAVLFGEVAFLSHKKIMDGMLSRALEKKINIFLFTCEGWAHLENKEYGEGEFAIYELPDLSTYDGVIIDFDSIHDRHAREVLTNKLKKCKIPIVSFNIPLDIPGAVTIQLENVSGVKNSIDHLVKVHGVNSIHFISGPTHNRDALKRRDVFCNSMLENGLMCGPDDISYGDFQFHSGQKVVSKFFEEGRALPRAFFAANDQMAIGAMIELHKRGIKIPEDVIVMGYDDMRLASTIQPRLSTVRREEYKAGESALLTLERMIVGEKIAKPIVIKGKNIFSESCGCHGVEKLHKANIIVDMTEEKIYTANNLETLKSLTTVFSNINSFSAFTLKLQSYVEQMELDFFYLCLCNDREQYYEEIYDISEGKELARDTTKYGDKMTVALAYEHSEWHTYPLFDKSELLPKDCLMNRNGAYYIVLPVHHGNYCIGYCVVGNYRKKLEQAFIQHLVLGISNALGNIREHDLMEAMLARINTKWMYDELTGIFNRAGLWQSADKFIEEEKAAGKKIVVFFIDLDGLKKVNDIYGHEEGDLYIKSMADILKKNNENDIIARYGGDEFVVISSYNEHEDILDYTNSIDKLISIFNKDGAVHKLSASIGWQREEDFEELDLRKMIELSDQEMYVCKRKKYMMNEV